MENQCLLSEWKEESNAPPVNFTVFIESLCSDCKDFIEAQLWPVWGKIKVIMNLEIIPYGNAIVSTLYIAEFSLALRAMLSIHSALI